LHQLTLYFLFMAKTEEKSNNNPSFQAITIHHCRQYQSVIAGRSLQKRVSEQARITPLSIWQPGEWARQNL
jgi:hypothetical protein